MERNNKRGRRKGGRQTTSNSQSLRSGSSSLIATMHRQVDKKQIFSLLSASHEVSRTYQINLHGPVDLDAFVSGDFWKNNIVNVVEKAFPPDICANLLKDGFIRSLNFTSPGPAQYVLKESIGFFSGLHGNRIPTVELRECHGSFRIQTINLQSLKIANDSLFKYGPDLASIQIKAPELLGLRFHSDHIEYSWRRELSSKDMRRIAKLLEGHVTISDAI